MTWYYKGKPFLLDDAEQYRDYIGFVYLMETDDGLKYIGKKLLWKKKILPKNTRRKRRQITWVHSDWEKYKSSNKTLQEMDICDITRTIISFHKSKGELSYTEAKLQFDLGVLYDDRYLNGIIQCRINKKHLK